MMHAESLEQALLRHCPGMIHSVIQTEDMPTLVLNKPALRAVCLVLRDQPEFAFEQLIDLCGVDYQDYGRVEWETHTKTETGYSRAVDPDLKPAALPDSIPSRFAVVYHLLSITQNQRVRLRVFLDDTLRIDSVTDLWASANWYEREAFDLLGIVFEGHPDLRRILTDYGFVGHPFRKDFPLTGHVEMRYDAKTGQCIYAPVEIEPRVLVPKVIREHTPVMKQEGASHES